MFLPTGAKHLDFDSRRRRDEVPTISALLQFLTMESLISHPLQGVAHGSEVLVQGFGNMLGSVAALHICGMPFPETLGVMTEVSVKSMRGLQKPAAFSSAFSSA